MSLKQISQAKYFGPDDKGRDQAGTPAIIEVTSATGEKVRFFTLAARSEEDAEKINKCAYKIISMEAGLRERETVIAELQDALI